MQILECFSTNSGLKKTCIKEDIFLKKKKKKRDNIVVNFAKILLKNKSLLSIRENMIEWEKMIYCNYKKVL